MAVGMTGKSHGTLLVKHCGLSFMAKVKTVGPGGDHRKSHSNLFKELSHYFH